MTSHPKSTAASSPPAGPPPAVAAAAVKPGPGPLPPAADHPGPGDPLRMWTLEIPEGTVLRTSNDRLHRMEEHKRNKALRQLGQQLARAQHIPRVGRADVFTTYVPPPWLKKDRHPLASARVEDAGALYPSTKALLDGITDAGVFADDNFRHVRREIYQRLDGTCPKGQMRLHIIEVPS